MPLAIALLLSAAASVSSTPWRLSIDGYGPVRIGMTRPQVASALHATLTLVGGKTMGSDAQSRAPLINPAWNFTSSGRVSRR